jgi:hypothetical protein
MRVVGRREVGVEARGTIHELDIQDRTRQTNFLLLI